MRSTNSESLSRHNNHQKLKHPSSAETRVRFRRKAEVEGFQGLTTKCIPGAAEADIVGEDGRAVDVVVSVHRINPVDERNGQACVHGCFLEVVGHVVPLHHRCIHGGSTASPAQHTSCIATT